MLKLQQVQHFSRRRSITEHWEQSAVQHSAVDTSRFREFVADATNRPADRTDRTSPIEHHDKTRRFRRRRIKDRPAAAASRRSFPSLPPLPAPASPQQSSTQQHHNSRVSRRETSKDRHLSLPSPPLNEQTTSHDESIFSSSSSSNNRANRAELELLENKTSRARASFFELDRTRAELELSCSESSSSSSTPKFGLGSARLHPYSFVASLVPIIRCNLLVLLYL
nr:hypothetical protein Iba_chr15aCG14330 [Ipomoea batatas]